MRDEAFEQAELTLFYTTVTYRDETGAEKKAMRIKPYGSVKYAERGEEGGTIVPVTVSYEGMLSPEAGGSGQGGLRIFLEAAPQENDGEWMHSFGNP